MLVPALLVTLAAGVVGQPTPTDQPSTRPPAAESPHPPLDLDWRLRGDAIATKAIAFLRSRQDAETGGWSVPAKGQQRPHLPAISGLVIRGMLRQPGIDAKDPHVAKGVGYILKYARPDGGIYDTSLATYNTAICLSALALVDTPEARAALKPAQDFLKNSQWGTATPVGVGGAGGKESPETVGQEHPFYGGIGYGNRGRPDVSNLAFAIEAWRASGLPTDDPAFQKAIIFLQRCQMAESFDGKPLNSAPYAKGSRQNGFIYATAENQQTIGQGQSFAGTIEESMDDGTKVSRLRAYGSMTYAGFKSYIYAGLKPDDYRVRAAMDWISRNYTLLEHPHMGSDGYYYFMVMFARAMEASGSDTLDIASGAPLRTTLYFRNIWPLTSVDALKSRLAELGAPTPASIVLGPLDNRPHLPRRAALLYFADEAAAAKAAEALANTPLGMVRSSPQNRDPVGASPQQIEWRQAVIEQLAMMQNDDGSFKSIDDRWMENDPVLITAYALIAAQSALRPPKN